MDPFDTLASMYAFDEQNPVMKAPPCPTGHTSHIGSLKEHADRLHRDPKVGCIIIPKMDSDVRSIEKWCLEMEHSTGISEKVAGSAVKSLAPALCMLRVILGSGIVPDSVGVVIHDIRLKMSGSEGEAHMGLYAQFAPPPMSILDDPNPWATVREFLLESGADAAVTYLESESNPPICAEDIAKIAGYTSSRRNPRTTNRLWCPVPTTPRDQCVLQVHAALIEAISSALSALEVDADEDENEYEMCMNMSLHESMVIKCDESSLGGDDDITSDVFEEWKESNTASIPMLIMDSAQPDQTTQQQQVSFDMREIDDFSTAPMEKEYLVSGKSMYTKKHECTLEKEWIFNVLNMFSSSLYPLVPMDRMSHSNIQLMGVPMRRRSSGDLCREEGIKKWSLVTSEIACAFGWAYPQSVVNGSRGEDWCRDFISCSCEFEPSQVHTRTHTTL